MAEIPSSLLGAIGQQIGKSTGRILNKELGPFKSLDAVILGQLGLANYRTAAGRARFLNQNPLLAYLFSSRTSRYPSQSRSDYLALQSANALETMRNLDTFTFNAIPVTTGEIVFDRYMTETRQMAADGLNRVQDNLNDGMNFLYKQIKNQSVLIDTSRRDIDVLMKRTVGLEDLLDRIARRPTETKTEAAPESTAEEEEKKKERVTPKGSVLGHLANSLETYAEGALAARLAKGLWGIVKRYAWPLALVEVADLARRTAEKIAQDNIKTYPDKEKIREQVLKDLGIKIDPKKEGIGGGVTLGSIPNYLKRREYGGLPGYMKDPAFMADYQKALKENEEKILKDEKNKQEKIKKDEIERDNFIKDHEKFKKAMESGIGSNEAEKKKKDAAEKQKIDKEIQERNKNSELWKDKYPPPIGKIDVSTFNNDRTSSRLKQLDDDTKFWKDRWDKIKKSRSSKDSEIEKKQKDAEANYIESVLEKNRLAKEALLESSTAREGITFPADSRGGLSKSFEDLGKSDSGFPFPVKLEAQPLQREINQEALEKISLFGHDEINLKTNQKIVIKTPSLELDFNRLLLSYSALHEFKKILGGTGGGAAAGAGGTVFRPGIRGPSFGREQGSGGTVFRPGIRGPSFGRSGAHSSGGPKGESIGGVHPHLIDTVNEAKKHLPPGYTAKILSGRRVGGGGYHPQGLASDVQIYDEKGQKLDWYQNAKTYRIYEQFAQNAKKIQSEKYPNENFAWGGYFANQYSGKGPMPYGTADAMHMQWGGPMGGGTFEKGASGAVKEWLDREGGTSQGMGSINKYKLPPQQQAQEGQSEGTVSNEFLANKRAKFFKELDTNPELKDKVMRTIRAEDSTGHTGVLESMINRADAHGFNSLNQEINSGFYGPVNRNQPSFTKSLSDTDRKQAEKTLGKVRGGSNVIDLRTDQGMEGEHGNQPRKTQIEGEWYSDKYPKWREEMMKEASTYKSKSFGENAKPIPYLKPPLEDIKSDQTESKKSNAFSIENQKSIHKAPSFEPSDKKETMIKQRMRHPSSDFETEGPSAGSYGYGSQKASLGKKGICAI